MTYNGDGDGDIYNWCLSFHLHLNVTFLNVPFKMVHFFHTIFFPVQNEFHQRLKFNRRGLVGMASGNDGMNGSQFFFTLSATPDLDRKHTLFGKVCHFL